MFNHFVLTMSLLTLIPTKKMTKPIRREKKMKCGVKVSYQYYHMFKEHELSKLNPTKEDEEEMLKKTTELSYKFDEPIQIDSKNVTNFIKKHFRIIQGKTSYDSVPVPIPPYILGIWLGDGHSRTIGLTNIDKCIINAWYKFAEYNNLNMRIRGKKPRTTAIMDYETEFTASYFITNGNGKHNPIFKMFKYELNLIQNKHIPEIYLKNDENVRLELLAGLLDTDGSLNNQSYEIIQKNKKLSYDIVDLCKSLGFDTKISNSRKCCTNSKNENHMGIYYRIRISVNQITPTIPVRCERKKLNFSKFTHFRNKRFETTQDIVWTEDLDKELYITVKSFQSMEPNKRIPWTRLENFNLKLPANKSEALRARYDKYIAKTPKFDHILDRLQFNPIEPEWMSKYNEIYNIWNNHNNDGLHKTLLSKELSIWFQNQKRYLDVLGCLESKKKLIRELIDIQKEINR